MKTQYEIRSISKDEFIPEAYNVYFSYFDDVEDGWRVGDRIIFIKDLFHRIDGGANEYLDKCLAWIKKHNPEFLI